MKSSTSGPKRSRSSEPVPTLTSGLSSAGAGGGVGAVAPVVVGVDVEQHEGPAGGHRVEPLAEARVELVVHARGCPRSGRRTACRRPTRPGPSSRRAAVDRLVARAVEVDLEAGAVARPRGPTAAAITSVCGSSSRSRTSSSRTMACRDLGPQVVPGVHRGGHDLRVPAPGERDDRREPLSPLVLAVVVMRACLPTAPRRRPYPAHPEGCAGFSAYDAAARRRAPAGPGRRRPARHRPGS